MLLMNGKKMSKSDGNTISPTELFTGDSPHVSKGYSPMVVRFFMLQSHYRSTLDLTDEALLAAEKGYRRLMEANRVLQELQAPANASAGELDKEINDIIDQAYAEMNDDFNTPRALARLFELVTRINGLKDGHLPAEEVSTPTLNLLKETFRIFIFDLFGLQDEIEGSDNGQGLMNGLMEVILNIREEARTSKNWATSDLIRDSLKELGIQVKDGKEGATWTME
jgi:cysteinyl-tRNA synthetase